MVGPEGAQIAVSAVHIERQALMFGGGGHAQVVQQASKNQVVQSRFGQADQRSGLAGDHGNALACWKSLTPTRSSASDKAKTALFSCILTVMARSSRGRNLLKEYHCRGPAGLPVRRRASHSRKSSWPVRAGKKSSRRSSACATISRQATPESGCRFRLPFQIGPLPHRSAHDVPGAPARPGRSGVRPGRSSRS